MTKIIVPVGTLLIKIDYCLRSYDEQLPFVLIDFDVVARIIDYLIDDESHLSNHDLWNGMVLDIESLIEDEETAYKIVEDLIEIVIAYLEKFNVMASDYEYIRSWSIRNSYGDNSEIELNMDC